MDPPTTVGGAVVPGFGVVSDYAIGKAIGEIALELSGSGDDMLRISTAAVLARAVSIQSDMDNHKEKE